MNDHDDDDRSFLLNDEDVNGDVNHQQMLEMRE